MSYIIDRTIQSYIDDERKRCATLAAKIDDKALLLFCISAPYTIDEIKTARQRFEEMKPVGNVEDLM